MIQLVLYSAVIILVYATVWFLISVIIKRNDIADIAWGMGYILLCIYYLLSTELSSRTLILYILVFLWGIRLAIHIFIRNRGKKEDFRYLNWRNEWGKSFYIRSYFQVYLLQGFFLLIIIFPITIASSYSQPSLNLLDLIGIGLWCLGFYFEAVGDYQLSTFLKNPSNKGKIIQTGLWKYTRHPNYFGEVVIWWGLFLIAVNSPYGWIGLLSPILITFLILFVSGIPMLEEKYKGNEAYEEYRKKTSKFIPLPKSLSTK